MVNKVILLGILGADPDVRVATGSIKVSRLRLATSETFKDKNTGEKKTTTEWHTVVLWRQVAEIAEKYLKKGSMVYVEGKLSTREYVNDDPATGSLIYQLSNPLAGPSWNRLRAVDIRKSDPYRSICSILSRATGSYERAEKHEHESKRNKFFHLNPPFLNTIAFMKMVKAGMQI